eukprot:1886606-Pleurochrysis_carterae.AAC.9
MVPRAESAPTPEALMVDQAELEKELDVLRGRRVRVGVRCAALHARGQVDLKCSKKNPTLMDAARALQLSIPLQHGSAECLAAARTNEAAHPADTSSNAVPVDAFAYMTAQSVADQRAVAVRQKADEAVRVVAKAEAERAQLRQ